jgi:hypothetical protein
MLLAVGIGAVPLLPFRLSRVSKWQPAPVWGAFAASLFVLVAVELVRRDAPPFLWLALATAVSGIFLCAWGSVVGLKVLLDSRESLEALLEGDRASIRAAFEHRLCRACSLSRTLAGGLIGGGVITLAIYLQNTSGAGTAFARSFYDGRHIFYVVVFLSAFWVGVGHVCIGALTGAAATVREFGFRPLYSVIPVYSLSNSYLKLASLCLLVYANYLLYLYAMWLGGVRFSPAVNLLAASVGAVVLVVYLIPQVAIHIALKRNRQRLIDGAISHLERVGNARGVLTPEQQDAVVTALDYLAHVRDLPTWGLRFRELTTVVCAYALPLLAFLEAQGKRLLSMIS